MRGTTVARQNMTLRGRHLIAGQRIIEIREMVLSKISTVQNGLQLRHRLWFEDSTVQENDGTGTR